MQTNNQDMQGKVCLITGATAGLGQATALLLAARGATIVGVGRTRGNHRRRRSQPGENKNFNSINQGIDRESIC